MPNDILKIQAAAFTAQHAGEYAEAIGPQIERVAVNTRRELG